MQNNNEEQAQQLDIVPSQSAFSDASSFEHAQRVAKMLSSTDLIPQAYRGNIQNTMVALEMANRIGASPLMVMQNLNIIQGKPGWGSSFIIATINASGKFSEDLDFEVTGEDVDMECHAYAPDAKNGKMKKSPTVTMKMAKSEGWIDKPGSKWKTMPELMIRYRAAAFFGRLYVPELMMGMQSVEEMQDTRPTILLIEHEDLVTLFDLKRDAVPESEIKNIERIINNKEKNSYSKVHKLLMSL